MRRLDVQEVEKIRDSYRSGFTVRDAHLSLNMSLSTISKYYAVFRAEGGRHESSNVTIPDATGHSSSE